MPKKTVAKINSDSIDQLDLQSLNDYKFIYFCSTTLLFKFIGRVIYSWKGLENNFLAVYYTPPNF
jgi:hypothetical protein